MLKTEINPKKICKCQQIRVSLRQFFRFRSFFYEIAHEVGSILHQPLLLFIRSPLTSLLFTCLFFINHPFKCGLVFHKPSFCQAR